MQQSNMQHITKKSNINKNCYIYLYWYSQIFKAVFLFYDLVIPLYCSICTCFFFLLCTFIITFVFSIFTFKFLCLSAVFHISKLCYRYFCFWQKLSNSQQMHVGLCMPLSVCAFSALFFYYSIQNYIDIYLLYKTCHKRKSIISVFASG